LVWNEYLEFLKNNGIDVDKYGLKEGYYWLDNQIVKAYDKKGILHKIVRLFIDEKLNVQIKTVYKNKVFEIESWKETVDRNKEKLYSLERSSKKLIQDSMCKYDKYIPKILSSGGKDSSVVSYLSRQIDENIEIIFNNTTLDCADTYIHIKQQGNVRIVNPQEGFYQWRKRLNFVGNRISRACCTLFKEGSMVESLDGDSKLLFFMGMRNEESNTRSKYGNEWKKYK